VIGLLALTMAGLASADSPPPVQRVVWLTATLNPSNTTSAAAGRWAGLLVYRRAHEHPAEPPRECPPLRKRAHPKPNPCRSGGVTPIVEPGTEAHWVLVWELSVAHLSSAVSGADIRVIATPGAAPTVAATLCGSCTSGRIETASLTNAQANAVLQGQGSVVVRTASNPGGEISGQIVKVPSSAFP
jgi:CHRD domain